MNNYKKYFFIMKWLIVLALLTIIFNWLFDKDTSTQPKLKTIKAERMSISHETTATGQIRPRVTIKIKSQANGLIEEILVAPGQWVKRGDLLARVRLQADPIKVNMSQTQINKALLQNERAFLELERQLALHEKNIISDTEFQDTKLKYEVTLSNLKQAKRELELRIKGTSGKFKTTSTLIYASINGMILEKFVELGDFVIKANDLSEGTTTFTIADMNDLIFKGEVDEVDTGKLQIGMPLNVTVGALPEETFLGILEFISPQAKKTDEGRNVIEVHAAIKAKENKILRAGYSATSQIILTQRSNVLAIPDNTLIFNEETPYVKVLLKSGQVVDREIILGLSNGMHSEVISGVGEKDLIVIPQSSRRLN